MLPKSESLKERYLFNLAFKKKQKVSSRLISLYYLFLDKKRYENSKSLEFFPKVAFVVSTKIDKRATLRNLIKRRMKASYKAIKANSEAIKKDKLLALIWIANIDIKDSKFAEIKFSMENLLNKLNQVVSN